MTAPLMRTSSPLAITDGPTIMTLEPGSVLIETWLVATRSRFIEQPQEKAKIAQRDRTEHARMSSFRMPPSQQKKAQGPAETIPEVCGLVPYRGWGRCNRPDAEAWKRRGKE